MPEEVIITTPPTPTADQCSAIAKLEWGPENCSKGVACWYPQMGGYTARCVIIDNHNDGCFDAYVWHDGEFPFSGEDEDADGDTIRNPAHLHHCDPEQFIRFGTLVSTLLAPTAEAPRAVEAKGTQIKMINADTCEETTLHEFEKKLERGEI